MVRAAALVTTSLISPMIALPFNCTLPVFRVSSLSICVEVPEALEVTWVGCRVSWLALGRGETTARLEGAMGLGEFFQGNSEGEWIWLLACIL